MTEIRDEDRRLVKDEAGFLWEEFFIKNTDQVLRSEQISLNGEPVALNQNVMLKIIPNQDYLKSSLVQAMTWFLVGNDPPIVMMGNEMVINLVTGKMVGVPPIQKSFIISAWLTQQRPAGMDKKDFLAELKAISIETIKFAESGDIYNQVLKCIIGRYSRRIRITMMIEIDQAKEENGMKLMQADLVTRSLRIGLRDDYEKPPEA